ncbi:hypothetical protein NT01EI_3839 [Edwardsiella ictaluri 93-146]|uniref:Uncharacterized protein n=1 Tax=Edwardsiella ictaluri (strain 93-146) TaxID=634503 RepID=C5BC52_EDWI9|nr:hypothetical protein NT01EI_3839 [Edwardsiella ictaluri 93-146]
MAVNGIILRNYLSIITISHINNEDDWAARDFMLIYSCGFV